MARRQPEKLVFPADIHHIAADIRRQVLQHPDKDPVVPGAPRPRPKKRTAAKPAARKRKTATKAKRRK